MRRWAGSAVVGLLLQVVQFGGIYGGFALGVPAALSALVMLGLSPLVTTALAVASGQERADGLLWAGLAVGVVGVAISLAPELGSAGVGAGIALTIAGMLGLSGGTVLQKRWVGVADPGVSAAVQSVTGAIVVAPATWCSAATSTCRPSSCCRSRGSCSAWASISLLAFVYVLRHHAASSVAALLLRRAAGDGVRVGAHARRGAAPGERLGMLVAMVGVGAVLRREGQASCGRRSAARSSRSCAAAPRSAASAGPGSRRSNSGLPVPITTGTTVTQTSSSSPRVGELRGDVPAADDPQLAVAGRGDHLVVEIGDRGVGDP